MGNFKLENNNFRDLQQKVHICLLKVDFVALPLNNRPNVPKIHLLCPKLYHSFPTKMTSLSEDMAILLGRFILDFAPIPRVKSSLTKFVASLR